MLISIVIPVYKSTGTLKELTQRIEEVFLKLSDLDYEIIFVNDSPFWEETKIVLRELLESPQRIVAVELTKNFGQHAATLCGFEIARGDYVLTMDDDLQHAPEDIPLLLEHASHDAVIAKFPDKQHSLFRRVMSRVKSEFERIILEKPAEIRLTAFRLLNISIAKKNVYA